MEMPRKIKNLTDMEIDEISLVDKGANQHAMITIAKRAPEEDQMPKLYDEDGSLLEENSLQNGQVVYDDEGVAYQYVIGDEGDDNAEAKAEEEKQLAEVGKSAFFQTQTNGPSQTDFSKSIMEELSKAFSDEDRDAVFAKAMTHFAEIEKRQADLEKVAKAERDLRLTREYVSKAAEYNLPVDANELGPVLYRMAESMSYDDCAVIAKCLETAGTILFEEMGYQGGGDNNDVMSQVEKFAMEEIGKSVSPQDITKVFEENPDAYDQYLAAQRGL